MKKSKVLFIVLFLAGFTMNAQELIFSADSCTHENDAKTFQRILTSNMDNMLDLWYVKRELMNSQSVLCRLQDDSTAYEANDSLMVDRLSKISSVIPLAYNENVKRWIELYVDKRKRSSSAMLGLAQYYFPWMQEIFDRYDVPEELVYLTIIESSLNPNAVSRAGATGIWQFMYTTGKMYGLEVNTFIDDRRDPYKATDAAARHLRDLYSIFGDWGLAIAAYNCGPSNVRKAIARSGGGKHDFWSICRYLPRETQNYFPAYIGALYLMKYHSQYGITPADIAISFSVDTVMVTRELHLEQVSEVLDIDIKEVMILNPQYKRGVIPAYAEPYPLRLKAPDIIRFLESRDSVHAYQYETFFAPLKIYENMFTGRTDPNVKSQNIYHTVQKGETLSKIANRYHLSVYELKKMNRLASNTIKPKQRLLVGYKAVSKTPVQTAVKTEEKRTEADARNAHPPSPETLYAERDQYVVQKGDTFYAIARKLNVSAEKLADYNGIKNMNVLSVGQKLKIPR